MSRTEKDLKDRFSWLQSRTGVQLEARKKCKRKQKIELGNRFQVGSTLLAGDSLKSVSFTEVSPEIWRFFDPETPNVDSAQPAVVSPSAQPRKPENQTPDTVTGAAEINVLLVEDNPGHVRLMQEAFSEAQRRFCLTVAEDGVQALEILKHAVDKPTAWRPDLVLLDLNLPRKDGREALVEIKTDSRLATIPVVILTSSSDEDDVRTSYGLQANCYITKPENLAEFANVVRMIESFWGRFVSLP